MAISVKESKEFINDIIRDANAGRNFVPFIGSGLSSPSGIIMGVEFTNYLAFTVFLVLSDPKHRKRTHGEGKLTHWDLKRQGWPPLPSERECGDARRWIQGKFEDVCGRLQLEINYGEGTHKSVKSLRPRTKDTSLGELLSALTQPPIPMILRAADADREDERIKKFTRYLSHFSAHDARQSLQDLSSRMSTPGLSNRDIIVELGIRALSDWRETLSFLAMVRLSDSHPSRLEFVELDSSIIDAFNSSITRDKRANLGHKIIAHLSEPLRVSTLLTTNFDTLTEDAYRALSLPLRILPVSAKGTLPNARTVASSDTLVKLHGESHDTRADLSLDEEPDAIDKATFSEYMARGTGNVLKSGRDACASRDSSFSNRLLVLGYSGNDHRCMQMMKHWLETSPDEARIYWVCFSDSDVKRVQDLFSSPTYTGAVTISLSSRPDLLLYELYQRLVLSLPPGGLVHEFSHMLPPTRKKHFDNEESDIIAAVRASRRSRTGSLMANYSRRLVRDATTSEVRDAILAAVDHKIKTPDRQSDHPLCVTRLWLPVYRHQDGATYHELIAEAERTKYAFWPVVIDACGGVVRASALAVEKLSRNQFKKVFWFELQEYMDGDSLLRDMLRSIALRFGKFQSGHVTIHPFTQGLHRKEESYRSPGEALEKDPGAPNCTVDSRLEQLCEHLKAVLAEYRVDAGSVVIFLTGRDSYGNCAGIVTSTWPHGSANFFQLHLLIDALGRIGIPTVYFPGTKERAARKVENITKSIAVTRSQDESPPNLDDIDKNYGEWPFDLLCQPVLKAMPTDRNAQAYSVFGDVIQRAIEPFYKSWRTPKGDIKFSAKHEKLADELQHLEFVYALTLFRHSRHPNSICSEGVFPCPFRYQTQCLDNDFVRAMESGRWIEKLEDALVLFKKPGGAVWMHRDVRLSLQRIIEQTYIPLEEISGPLNAIRGNEWFGEVRARLHFWIGDWYHKAFCSSGHLKPVIEGVFHLISSALYAPKAAPKKREDHPLSDDDLQLHKQMLFESAVLYASKMLLFSWRWLELWQASSTQVSWLAESHIDDTKQRLDKAALDIYPKKGPGFDRMIKCVDDFRRIAIAVGEAMTLEGAGVVRKAQGGMSVETASLHLLNEMPTGEQLISLDHGVNVIRSAEGDFDNTIVEAFKQCRGDAEGLWNAIKDFSGKTSSIDADSRKARFAELKAKWLSNASALDLHNIVWVLGETAFVLLRRAKLQYHASKDGDIPHGTWLSSTICCSLAIDLCKHLPPWLLDFEIRSKVKLHCLYAVGLANNGRFYEATRHLNDAQALQSKLATVSKKDLAIVSLRRAEVKLTECHWIGRFLEKVKVEEQVEGKEQGKEQAEEKVKVKSALDFSFADRGLLRVGTVYFVLPDLNSGAVDCWKTKNIKRRINQVVASSRLHGPDDAFPDESQIQVVPPRIFECIREAVPVGEEMPNNEKWIEATEVALRRLLASLVDEASRALDVAHLNLAGISQSTLWWSRMSTLSLRLFSLLKYLPEYAEKSLVFRKQSADTGIYSHFVSAIRIAGEDDFRRYRSLRYFLEANRWYVESMKDPRKDLPSVRDYLSYLPDSFEAADQLASELLLSATKAPEEDSLRIAIYALPGKFPELKECPKTQKTLKQLGL